MKFKKSIILLSSLFILSACATPYDRDIAKSNNETIKNHSTQQTVAVQHKTGAIKGIFEKIADKCEGDEGFACGALLGLSGAMASRDIASIQTEEYKGPVQKTGVDVQYKVAEEVGNGIPIAGMTITTVKAIDKDKGTTNNTASEGSSVEYTYKEEHATSVSEGDSEATNSPGGDGNTSEEVVALPVE